MRQLLPCGTVAAYHRHLAHGETACADCKHAMMIYQRIRATDRRAGIHRLLPGDGTKRRLRSLQAIGWTTRALAAELGVHQREMHRLMTRDGKISRQTVDNVVNLFDRLQAVQNTPKVLNWHQRKELPPPAAWDEETIDDPLAQPFPWRRVETSQHRAEDLLEDYAELLSYGETEEAIAQRLGMTVGAMRQALHRSRKKLALASVGQVGQQPNDQRDLGDTVVGEIDDGAPE